MKCVERVLQIRLADARGDGEIYNAIFSRIIRDFFVFV